MGRIFFSISLWFPLVVAMDYLRSFVAIYDVKPGHVVNKPGFTDFSRLRVLGPIFHRVRS